MYFTKTVKTPLKMLNINQATETFGYNFTNKKLLIALEERFRSSNMNMTIKNKHNEIW
jgi:hypothetical protein